MRRTRYRFDCFRLLADLQKAGVSNDEVARRLDEFPHTVSHWKRGGQPLLGKGLQLILLYTEVVGPVEIQNFSSTTTYKVVITPAAI